uniref:Uncharacterized protein n=1 Tax=Piliocolobus tephrosceles TaxID=591936 RepID=A0A8C9GD17_9PRIM
MVPSRNGIILNLHFYKNWQWPIATWFTQPSRKNHKRWPGPLISLLIQEGETSPLSPCRPMYNSC